MLLGPARAARVLALVVASAVLLSGCLFGRPVWQPGGEPPVPADPTAQRPSGATPRALPPRSPVPTPSGPVVRRPVQPVPDVQPEGFTEPPAGSGLARYTAQRLTWSDCEDLECARVKAPLDYTDPDGQAITLALSRRPAVESPRLGSLFINPGGPGASGVNYVGFFEADGLEQYDIVGWDPRGVGRSTPVSCYPGDQYDDYIARDASPDTPAEDAALRESEQAFGRSCLERSGRLLEHVSTADTVRDLDLLRVLVGDEKLNYFGSSYGTQIGATYAELFPDNLGRAVLDGAVNITDDRSVSQAQGFDRALTAFAGWCADQRCRLGGNQQEVLDTISGLWQELDAVPMTGGRRPLSQQLAAVGVMYLLYGDEDYWKFLRQGLESAVFDRDPRQLLQFADGYYERDRTTGVFGQWNFAFPAVRCLDSDRTDPAESLRQSERDKQNAPTLAVVSGPDYVCPMWPVAPAPDLGTITGEGAAPIVVIGTTGDPATPYEYAQKMADQLESGVLVSYRGEGHLAYGSSPCVQRIVRDYLVEDRVPADGVSC